MGNSPPRRRLATARAGEEKPLQAFRGWVVAVLVWSVLLGGCGRDSPTVPPAPPPPPPLPRPPALEIEVCGPLYTDLRFSEVPGATFYEFERRYTEHGEWERLLRRDARLLSPYATGSGGTEIYRHLDYEPYIDGIRVSIWYRVRAELADGRTTEWSELWYCEALPVREEIPTDHRFVRWFWDQLAFDAYECPNEAACPDYYQSGESILPLRERRLYVLPDPSPDIYIRTERDTGGRGFSSSQIRTLRRVIPDAISALTGEPFTGRITEGSADRDRDGSITIVAVRAADDREQWAPDDDGRRRCGQARTGWTNGKITLNLDAIRSSRTDGYCWLESILRHEMGHALGFFHVRDTSDVMYADDQWRSRFSSREEYHAQLAYQYGRATVYEDGPLHTGGKHNPDRRRSERPKGPVVTCGLRH